MYELKTLLKLREQLLNTLPPEKLEYVNDLTNEELDFLYTVVHEVKEKGYSPTYDEFKRIDYKEELIDPHTFLLDDYYLGEMGKAVYELNKKHFINICNNNLITEIIFSGAIGIGKDYLSINKCDLYNNKHI